VESPILSIVIPAWNEEACIGRTLDTVCGLTSGRGDVEIILCVSGDDRTTEIAAGYPVTICRSEKGRALQMNTGASKASGSILYFLHADTTPPPTFCDDILTAVSQGTESGCFRMNFDDPHWVMALFGWFTQFPLTLCRGGDQSLFITRTLFETIGRFNEAMHIMEDIEIIERIERHAPLHILETCVTTSARKYHENGMIRLQTIFGIIHFMYATGYDQEAIREFYRNSIT
jgi:rSAM/selenodomain-associated transferase 2